MYGYRKARKEEKKILKHEKKYGKKEAAKEEKYVSKHAGKEAATRQADISRGQGYTQEFLNKPQQGLTPEYRKALQAEANRNIDRQQQRDNRRLIGELSQRGIHGKSGVQFAQQKELARNANEARGNTERGLTQLDADLALKKTAAILAGGHGEAAASNLDRQVAIDALRYKKERANQRAVQNANYRSFSMV